MSFIFNFHEHKNIKQACSLCNKLVQWSWNFWVYSSTWSQHPNVSKQKVMIEAADFSQQWRRGRLGWWMSEIDNKKLWNVPSYLHVSTHDERYQKSFRFQNSLIFFKYSFTLLFILHYKMCVKSIISLELQTAHPSPHSSAVEGKY